MTSEQPQQTMRGQAAAASDGKEERKRGMNELPLQSSPYVKYSDLEEYKQQGYGTQGHLPVEDIHGGGTDAPTISGSGLTARQVQAADAINRQAPA